MKLEGTAEYQYMQLKRMNHDIPVEQALRTKGALLFYFSSEPSGGLPAGQAHVAISLGDGRTVEAKGTKYGVGEWSAKHRFNFAATVPGISDESGLKAHREATSAGTGASEANVDAAPTVGHASGSGAGVYGSSGTVDGADPSPADGRAADPAPTSHAASAVNGSPAGNGSAPVNGFAPAKGAAPANGSSAVNGTDAQTSSATAYQIDPGRPVARLPGAAETDPDSDADGLTDAFEKLAGTDPGKADSDDDGLSDGHEAVVTHTDPLAADTDGDGVADAQEVSLGTDAGRLPGVAGVVGSGRFAENIRKGVEDADGDGLSDRTEQLAGTNAKSADTDGDQLSDSAEASLGTDPTKADSDADGVFDGVEVQFGADPLNAASTIGPAGGGQGGLGADPLGQPGGLDPSGGLTSGIGGDFGQGLGQAPGTGIGGADETTFDPVGSPQGDASESLDLG